MPSSFVLLIITQHEKAKQSICVVKHEEIDLFLALYKAYKYNIYVLYIILCSSSTKTLSFLRFLLKHFSSQVKSVLSHKHNSAYHTSYDCLQKENLQLVFMHTKSQGSRTTTADIKLYCCNPKRKKRLDCDCMPDST